MTITVVQEVSPPTAPAHAKLAMPLIDETKM